MNFRYKLMCLSLASLSSLFYCLRPGQEPTPRVEHLKGSSIGYILPSPTNIILSWKDLPRTNALPYYKYSKLTAVRHFMRFLPKCFSQYPENINIGCYQGIQNEGEGSVQFTSLLKWLFVIYEIIFSI
jgi:hypothetical protein